LTAQFLQTSKGNFDKSARSYENSGEKDRNLISASYTQRQIPKTHSWLFSQFPLSQNGNSSAKRTIPILTQCMGIGYK